MEGGPGGAVFACAATLGTHAVPTRLGPSGLTLAPPVSDRVGGDGGALFDPAAVDCARVAGLDLVVCV